MHLLWLGTVALEGDESLRKKNERDRNKDVGKYLLACRNLYANVVYNLYLATGDFMYFFGELLMSP
jgi:hypothetical protein